ncbi:MAG TPA: BlaI/MecI/CopY family transcriptional regulator [Thermoanaerobaculia bacterium]|nr:BlaI/MecI/CopY family transcriptional regulator [Thermoanaerobaculia bacterium]
MPQHDLSRRERQILDVIYRLGRATATDVLDQLDDAPTYTTVRGLLRVLEAKGHIRHDDDGGRYVYHPTVKKERAARLAIKHVIGTFFNDSPSEALAALLGNAKRLDAAELERLAELVEAARRKERR